jgi:transcription elongation factor Elf1
MANDYTTPNQFRDLHMKCPNCSSQMFIADETVSSKSHVTFFHCSLCVSKHVSSEPIVESLGQSKSQLTDTLFAPPAARVQYAV